MLNVCLFPCRYHLEGLPLGARRLLRLTSAIVRWGGKLALRQVQLVLHVNADELSSVLIDLKARGRRGHRMGCTFFACW